MGGLIERILAVPGVLVYVLFGLLVFAEDALFIGFVIPGETAAVLGGVDASRGHVELWLMILVVVVAAIVGDTVGYEIGRQVGPRILQARMLRRHQRRLGDAQDFLARRGGSAVFLGRFVAFFRAVIPALAGTARMPYHRFLAFNAAGVSSGAPASSCSATSPATPTPRLRSPSDAELPSPSSPSSSSRC
jgi:membrane protein DedA with SNARE-associated domain